MLRSDHSTPFPDYIDSTMRNDYVSCPTKFYWSWVRRLTRSKVSIDLHAGAAFAKGIEAARRYFHDGKCDEETAIAHGAKALILYYGDFDPGDSPKTLVNMVSALVYYFEVWPLSTDHLQPYRMAGKLAVEFTFSLPIPNTQHPVTGMPILYCGRADMIGQFGEQLFTVDEKTTKQLGPSWSKNWDLRGQFIGYNWAARELGNLPVVGTIIRGISILKNSHGHAEPIIYTPEWMIKKWLDQLSRDVNGMIRDWESGAWSQAFGDACASYSGCAFSALCTVPEPEFWIPNYYIRNEWNPMAKDPTEAVENLPAVSSG